MAAAAVVATEDLAVAGAIQEVVTRGVFRVYVNHDVIGCEVGGALKNVIAIAAGIGQGLGVGDNTRAAVMTRGLAELTRVGVALGAEPATFAGLAGMGDLVVTCLSPLSRNRAVGEQLGRGRPLTDILAEMHMVAEGVKTAELVLDLAARYELDLPICRVINRAGAGRGRAGGVIRPAWLDFRRTCGLRRSWVMALSFLYLAFVPDPSIALGPCGVRATNWRSESSCSVTKWRCFVAR